MKNVIHSSFFIYKLISLKILQVLSLECLDIRMMRSTLGLGMANKDVDTLLEQLGSACGVLKQQNRHDDVGSHLVETACEEILKILVALLLDVVERILILLDELGDARTHRGCTLADRTLHHLVHDREIGAVGDVADGSYHLQLGCSLVDREDARVAIEALALILHDEARTAVNLYGVVGVLVGILGVHTLS